MLSSFHEILTNFFLDPWSQRCGPTYGGLSLKVSKKFKSINMLTLQGIVEVKVLFNKHEV